MIEMRSVYPSRIDLRMMLTKVAGLGILLIAAYHLLRILPPTADIAGGLMLLIVAGASFLTVPVRYIITPAGLVVQHGVLRTHISHGSILRVHPGSTRAAHTALSLDQLAVEYRAGPHARPTVHISPVRGDEFLQELAAIAGLERRAQQWVRPAPPPLGDPVPGPVGS